MASTAGTNRADTRSASRCTGAFDPCAAATCRTIAASSVDAPTAVASQRSGPDSLTVPASTASPGAFATGSLSPVSIASFTDDSPASTRPSTATLSPARTTKTSPTRTDASGTSRVSPSRSRSTVAGCKLQEIADRMRRAGARAPLEELAEQHERDDDGGRLEIDVLARQRQQPDGDAVGKRGRRPERDQHVHVGGAAAQRLPCAGVEPRARPELDRRRERELQRRSAIRSRARPIAIDAICATNGTVSSAATTNTRSSRR